MPLWVLEYYVHVEGRRRMECVEVDIDDLLGEKISLAHEYIRKVCESKNEGDNPTLRYAKLVVDPEPGRDPLDGDPKIPLWVTFWPWHPDDDPDDESLDSPPIRAKLEFPARKFETTVRPDGKAQYASPALGTILLAIRRHLADGREGTIRKIEWSDDGG